jgi:hypothetical protein
MIVAQQNQNEDIYTLARVINPEQVPLVPTDVASISCAVYDLSTQSLTPVLTPTINVGAVMQPQLLTDYGWLQDDIGYNFRHRLEVGTSLIGGHTYRIEYRLLANSGLSWTRLYVNKAVTVLPQFS